MNSLTTGYGDRVRQALDDLPARQYLELVDGLDEHLREVADDDAALVEQLGEPERYAAELRASAGFGARATDTVRTAASPATSPVPTRRPIVTTRRLARIALVLVVSVFILIAINGELNVGALVFATALAFGAAWCVRRLLATVDLTPPYDRRATIALTIATVAFAAVLGAALSEKTSVQYVDSGPANQLVGADVTVPDVVGLGVVDATGLLQSLGLDVQFSGVDQSRNMVVTAQTPPAGTITAAGTVIVATLDRRAAGTALPAPLTTAAVPPVAPPTSGAPVTSLPAPSSSAPSSSAPSSSAPS